MEENEMESYEVQGRVGRSWQQVLHEGDDVVVPQKKKQKRDQRVTKEEKAIHSTARGKPPVKHPGCRESIEQPRAAHPHLN